MQTVRAKYRCREVVKSLDWHKKFLYTAKFSAVTDGSVENKKFFEYTPTGEISIGTYKDDVFEVGAEYYIDFTKCEASAQTESGEEPPPEPLPPPPRGD